MNERIRELYEQASSLDAVDSEGSLIEKFAELIVCECIAVCFEMQNNHSFRSWEVEPKDVAVAIAKRLGGELKNERTN